MNPFRSKTPVVKPAFIQCSPLISLKPTDPIQEGTALFNPTMKDN